ncbi:ABC transporter-like protein [Alicycliphilus sp. B1]|nr:ABC transporter-like protein [Alicycliphilus sp. B1]
MAAFEARFERQHPVPLAVELSCEPGEVLALVGPSGSGKSTTLKTIAGLMPGATGSIRVGGQPWLDSARQVDLPAHRRRVGMVFQSYALFPHLSALDNVLAGLDGPKDTRMQQARKWLEQVHMQGHEGKRPGQLSGGQQQRVALARALAREPDVLLLDEPFSAVDQMTRERLYEELAELRSRLSVPTLFVTHSIHEAQLLADRMVVIHRGRSLQAGTPDEVYRRPAEADIARLMGHRNVFSGRVAGDATTGCVLDWAGLSLRASEANPGREVSFMIPATDIRILEPDENRPNAVDAKVLSVRPLGDQVLCKALLPNSAEVWVSTSPHTVRKRGICADSAIRLAFSPQAIHLMPPGTLRDTGRA